MSLTLSEIDCITLRRRLFTMQRDGLVGYVHDRFMPYIHVTQTKVTLRRYRGLTVTIYKVYGKHRTCGIKFDWSPRLITPETYERFNSLVDGLVPGGMGRLLHESSIRYIEIALDVQEANVHDYLMAFPRIARSYVYYNPRDDSQSSYLGTLRGKKSFICYDKKRELRARHAYITRKDLLRVEFKSRERHTLSSLRTLPNPFNNLLVVNINTARNLNSSPDWQYFIDRCEYMGAQQALVYFSPRRKRTARHQLGVAQAPWMNAAEIWERWPQLIANFENQHQGLFRDTGRSYSW